MKKISMSALIIGVVLCAIYAQAANNGDENKGGEVPPGMRVEKVGDLKVVLPQGAGLRKKGDVLVVESTAEYAAQKFIEVDNRLVKLESEKDNLRREIDKIKEDLNDIKRRPLSH